MTSSQVKQFLQNLNDAWLTRDYARLAHSYHADVVLLPPDAGEPMLGRTAVLETYKEFHAACLVEQFSVTEQASWSFSSAADDITSGAVTTMVHMRFAIDYRFAQSPHNDSTNPPTSEPSTDALLQSEQGMDVYTLTQDSPDSDPKIIWRAQFTL